MEHIYRRVSNLDEKIKDISLPYLEWKTLFLISENTSIAELESLLAKDKENIQSAIDVLENKGLVELVEVEEEVVEETTAETETEAVGIDLKEEVAPEEEIEPVEETNSGVDLLEEEKVEETTPAESEPSHMTDFIEELGELEGTAEETGLEFDTESTEAEKESTEEQPDIETTVAEEPTEPAEEEIITDSGKKSIMVIDDSIVIRKMVEIALEEEDYRIISSISGKEGMKMLDDENPSLVIVDMMLPDMNGIDVLKTIKASKGIPVIMLSGKDSPQLIETAKNVGADDFLPKPFKDEELIEKVKSLLK